MEASESVYGLGERGLLLWQRLESGDAARDAVALEAARTADRLDELDNIIQGKGVLNLMQFRVLSSEMADEGVKEINVEVKFQSVLSEARQQALALSGLLKSIGSDDAKSQSVPAKLPENVSPLQRLTSKLNG